MPGSNVRDRKTASPRKTCVPGVHAQATSGRSTRIAKAPARDGSRRPTHETNDERRKGCLDAKLFSPATNRAAQILELGLNEIVDRFARGFEVVAHPLSDLLPRNTIPGVDAFIPREASTAPRHERARARRAPGWPDGPLAPRPAPEQQGRSRTDGQANQRRREQIVFGLARFTPGAVATGASDARSLLPGGPA